MGLPRRTADDLVALGWEAVHIAALAAPTSTDQFILDLARQEGRVVVSLDSDFARLLALGNLASPSVVFIRIQNLDRSAATSLLSRVIPSIDGELTTGCIATVTERNIRIRTLPLR
jgi:predicted nuclease of predicted toxin-antitoxin system